MKRAIAFVERYLFALLSSFYLFTVGVFFHRHRDLIYTICKHFGYSQQPPKAQRAIPSVELAAVAPEDIAFQIREPVREGGNTSLLETLVIAKMVQAHRPRQLFEIGTFNGRTTLNLAANSPEDAHVYTLDLPREQLAATALPLEPGDDAWIDKERSGVRYLGSDCERKISQLYGDSATFDFAPFHNAIDFLFIDGSHSYEYVLNASRIALKLLREGRGVILWHDYGPCDGATRALNELYAAGGAFAGLRHIQGTSLVCLILS